MSKPKETKLFCTLCHHTINNERFVYMKHEEWGSNFVSIGEVEDLKYEKSHTELLKELIMKQVIYFEL